jgi:ABC-2 type transport system ATP-binding protein
MPLRLAGLTFTLGFGPATIGLQLDNVPPKEAIQNVGSAPTERARQLLGRAREATLDANFNEARDLLLTAQLEFGQEEQHHATILAARIQALTNTARDRAPDEYRKTQEDLIDHILSFIGRLQAEPASRGHRHPATAVPIESNLDRDVGGPLLAAYGVSLVTPSRVILRNVDAQLFPGEIVALVGRNGAGKTTLMRTLAGDVSPSAGEVAVAEDATGQVHVRLSRDQIAYSSQSPTRFSGTVDIALRRYAGLRRSPNSDRRTDVDYVIELMELDDYQDATWQTLSSGYRTRFELAKTLLSNPRVLLLDEPLGPLDLVSRQRYLRTLKDLARSERRQVGILVSTQEVDTVDSYVDRLIVLREGSIQYDGRPEGIGNRFGTALYELELARTLNRATLQKLRSIAGANLEVFGDVLRLELPLTTSADALLSAIAEAQLEVRSLRNLTNSAVRLFESAPR